MKTKRVSPQTVISVILLILLAFAFIFPLYWIVTGAFKAKEDIIIKSGEMVQWFPLHPTLENFARLFTKEAELFRIPIPFAGVSLVGPTVKLAIRWLANSVFISLASMVLTCITASLAGYALAKKRFWGRGAIFTLFVCAMALPKQVILIPLLSEMNALGLVSSPWSVVFPVVGWPFGVFLMKQFSETIPSALLEAARIDGAGELKTFGTVVLPIIKPGIGALAIFTFVNAWNEYPMQLVMLQQEQAKTIALGIASLQSEMSNDFGLIMAGAALAAVPIIVVFLCFQKYFTQGITMGAVKG